MNTPFKLDEHPRRPRLSEPPAGYFDQLPMRVMARLPRAEAPEALAWAWLTRLPAALRTSLAATFILVGFAASFWLSSPSQPAAPLVAAASLDTVPRTELVSYLLTSGARVENADLAVLTAADPELTKNFLQASDAELTDMLDTQPADELTYL